MRSSIARRSGPSASAAIAVLAHLVDQRAAGRAGRAGAAASAGRRSRPFSSSRTSSARCGRSHGTPPNCSAWVVSCSATQRSRTSGSASSWRAAWPRFGRDEQQPRGRRRGRAPGTRLAQHAPGEEAGDRAGLGARSAPARRSARRRARPSVGAEPVGDRIEHPAHARRGSPRSMPSRPTASARGSGAGPTGPCRRATRRSLSAAALGEASNGAGVAAATARPGHAVGHLPGEPPVDHRVHGGSGQPSRRHAGELASALGRARGHHAASAARRSSGAPSGSSQRRERDLPAGLAHDQLRRRRRRPRGSAQRHHPVEARRRHLAQRDRDRADRAQAVRDLGQRVGRSARPSAGRRTRGRGARAARRACGARAGRAAAARRRACAPCAAPRHPLLVRARSRRRSRTRRRPCTARRRPRSRSRAAAARAWRSSSRRSGRSPRARPAPPKSTSPRSSLTAREARAARVQPLELGEHARPRRPRRSPACGRRPPRACRSRARARRSSGGPSSISRSALAPAATRRASRRRGCAHARRHRGPRPHGRPILRRCPRPTSRCRCR